MAGVVLLAVHLFHEPMLALFYALFPLLAAVTLGWPAALVTELALGGLLWWLTRGISAPPLPVSYAWGVLAGGLLSGSLGWGATRALYTVTEWSIFSFQQAQQRLDQARNQRLEFKQMQEDLTQANRELARLSDRLKAMYQVAEDARRTKEEFVANVSHELRTPLNMIIGFCEMITNAPQVYGGGLPPALLADITAIQRNSQHLARLVDDVLDLSQVEAGKMVLTREWVNLPEIIDASALASGRALFESKGLYLHVEVPRDLPWVYCDSTRIRQVMLNLLSNAGRFTQQRRGRRARVLRGWAGGRERDRHRAGHRTGKPGQAVPAVPTARRVAPAHAWRHRAGAKHQQAFCGDARRQDVACKPGVCGCRTASSRQSRTSPVRPSISACLLMRRVRSNPRAARPRCVGSTRMSPMKSANARTPGGRLPRRRRRATS